MEPTVNAVCVPSSTPIKIIKWKVKKGAVTGKGSILCFYDTGNGLKQKLKSNEVGTVLELSCEEGETLQPGSAVLKIQSCMHPTVMKDMCADCGADLRMDLGVAGDRKEPVSASVAMVHCIPELIVSEEQALELGKEDENRLLSAKKLVLLVDLDQTLIHTTNDEIPANLKGVHHFQLWHGNSLMWYHTRIRPFTNEFLMNISKLYQLHICTFGVRMYAHTIAKLLDPEGKYFSHRILSRDECFNQNSKTANLKALFPCGDAMVCIIDDREDVWNFAPNLIHVKPYRFFQGTADINAPPGLTKTENDNAPVTHRVRRISSSGTNISTDDGSSNRNENSQPTAKSNVDVNKSESVEKSVVARDDDVVDESKVDIQSKTGMKSSDLTEKLIVVNSTSPDKQQGTDVANSESESLEQKFIPDTDVSVIETDGSKLTDEAENKNTIETMDKVGSEEPKNSDDMKESGDRKENDSVNEVEEIEWEDDDDYLFYLEDNLKRIHKAFYHMHEELKDTDQKPDLRNIIPYVKRKCLRGLNILFSGIIPTNIPQEKSQAYNAARSLGATIHTQFIPCKRDGSTEHTTHVIGAHRGTAKVRQAMKEKDVKIVNINWLWSCLERWEKVEEGLFSLSKVPVAGDCSPDVFANFNVDIENKNGKRRIEQNGDSTLSPNQEKFSKRTKTVDVDRPEMEYSELVQNANTEQRETDSEAQFKTSFNPLLMFSNVELSNMDKEVEDLMEDSDNPAEDNNTSDSESSVENDNERDLKLRQQVLSSSPSPDSSSGDSLAGDFPRGWSKKKKRRSRSHSHTSNEKDEQLPLDLDQESENEMDNFEKTVDAFAPESESDSNADSIGSIDEEIAKAVEREFLS